MCVFMRRIKRFETVWFDTGSLIITNANLRAVADENNNNHKSYYEAYLCTVYIFQVE